MRLKVNGQEVVVDSGLTVTRFVQRGENKWAMLVSGVFDGDVEAETGEVLTRAEVDGFVEQVRRDALDESDPILVDFEVAV